MPHQEKKFGMHFYLNYYNLLRYALVRARLIAYATFLILPSDAALPPLRA